MNLEKPKKLEKTIEQQINFQGNHWNLMRDRLENPIIFQRLINDLMKDKETASILIMNPPENKEGFISKMNSLGI